MNDPVRRISSREIYQGRIVRMREDKVVQRHGTEATYEYVEIKNGSSTLAIEENLDVWLVREWKYALGRTSLEVVSGGIEPGESPEAAAARELREEAGLEASELIPMGHVDPFTTMLNCQNYLFVARGLKPAPHDHEEGESIEVVRMSLKQALREVMEGGITHGSSCVLILKAAAKYLA